MGQRNFSESLEPRDHNREVKLILLKPCLLARLNGGEISLIERLRLLRSWGIEAKCFIALPESDRKFTLDFLKQNGIAFENDCYEIDGVSCHIRFSEDFHPEDLSKQVSTEDYFLSILKREKPDFVWTHYTDFFATTAALRWDPENLMVDMTDNEFPRVEKLDAIHRRALKGSIEPAAFVRHFEDAARVIESLEALPALLGAVPLTLQLAVTATFAASPSSTSAYSERCGSGGES